MHHFKYIILLIVLITFSVPTALLAGKPGDANKVADSAEAICPLPIGAKVPRLTLSTADGTQFNLQEAFSQKPTVLIFYRGGWCPFCNLHLAELKDIENDLIQLGYQILAVSMDRPAKLRDSMQKHEINYTLLSDSAAAAARAFGIAFTVSDEDVERLRGFNMDLEQASGKDHHILPVPAVFIIGSDGSIKFAYVNPNYKVRIKAPLLLAAARAELVEK